MTAARSAASTSFARQGDRTLNGSGPLRSSAPAVPASIRMAPRQASKKRARILHQDALTLRAHREPPRPGSCSASSVDARFRLSAATCGASTERFPDHRSTGEHGLRQFPLPRPDAVAPVLQDALLWTYTSSPVSQMEGGRPGFGAEHPTPSVPLLHIVKVVLGYPKSCTAPISAKCCAFDTVDRPKTTPFTAW
jgi:hypothetical protein